MAKADVASRLRYLGMWRSLVAHLTGGQGVAGSNPVIPTNLRSCLPTQRELRLASHAAEVIPSIRRDSANLHVSSSKKPGITSRLPVDVAVERMLRQESTDDRRTPGTTNTKQTSKRGRRSVIINDCAHRYAWWPSCLLTIQGSRRDTECKNRNGQRRR